MYLKEISCSGFKSFADKLSIVLDGKVTCIVGPNGSGKSNIVDAVRWVLGEQSIKSLRGNDNMADVIFSGSKSRNPLNVASVSLIFDNSDNYLGVPYQEVAIKRRIYRNGENEYFLNGEKCRLKDITDLLIDSSVGKESFNIISQGEVQKILSHSPYERRIIFESASGVLKYKRRKEEALRKLDKTQANLDRVLDIVNELETQIGPLKEQSEKATQYLETQDKLKTVEVALLATEIENIHQEVEKAKAKMQKLNTEILNLNVKNSNDDTTLINEKNNLYKLDLEIKQLNETLLDLTKKEEKLNGEKNILKERSKYQATDSKVHEQITLLHEKVLELENQIFLYNKDLDLLASDLGSIDNQSNKVEMELATLKSRRNNSVQEINIQKRTLLETEQKIEILTSYIESHGNANSTVKAVLNNPRLSGIRGMFGNILEVEDTYVKALEVAISSVRQFIIVSDEYSAKNAIAYLRDNNLGRATFFPMNVIKPKGVDGDTLEVLQKEEGFIQVLSSLVTYDSSYYSIVANQLGNVLVVDDIDSANRIAKKIHYRYKIVTLQGDIIHVGGSISGGSVKVSKSLVTDKKDLKNLEIKKVDLEALIKEEENSLDILNSSIKEKEEQLYQCKIKSVSLNELIRSKQSVIANETKLLQESRQELTGLGHVVDSSLSKEEDRIMKEYFEVSRLKEVTLKEIQKLSRDRGALNSAIEEMEAVSKINNTEVHRLEKELKEIEISSSKMDLKLDQYLTILSEEYELTYEKAKANFFLEMDVNEARIEVNKYKVILKNIGMVNINSIEDYKKVSERYDFLSTQRTDLEKAKETLFEIIHEMDEVMKEDFAASFQKIREEFKGVFQKLFHGGSADLKLTDPDDLLETGVEIVASPPGKTLKSISLLSGGEKTLTAISLIFAILNVKSVPFCIFDEVEAALDEANVDQFGHYLDNYRSRTQFLIITHKKRTMEYADTLYGITMQESGVSKLVGVKLDKIA